MLVPFQEARNAEIRSGDGMMAEAGIDGVVVPGLRIDIDWLCRSLLTFLDRIERISSNTSTWISEGIFEARILSFPIWTNFWGNLGVSTTKRGEAPDWKLSDNPNSQKREVSK